MGVCIRNLFALLVVSVSIAGGARADTVDATLAHAKRAVIARLDSLQNLRVEYDQINRTSTSEAMAKEANESLKRINESRPDGSKFAGSNVVFSTSARTETTRETVDLLAGRTRYEVNLTGDSLKVPAAVRNGRGDKTVFTITPSRIERLVQNGANPPTGYVYDVADEQPNLPSIDIALGIRAMGSKTWITDKEIDAMEVSAAPGRWEAWC